MAGLLDGGDFEAIGKKGSKGKGGGMSGNTPKIVLVTVLLVAAAGLFAWQFIFANRPPKVQPSTIPVHQPTAEEQKQMEVEKRKREKMLESGELSEAGA